jgi:hypothetical protein
MGVSAVIAGVGLFMQYSAGQEAKEASARQAQAMESSAAESRKQFQLQQKIADIKNARERVQMARQARIARANAVSTGALTGTSGSSGVMGGVASIGSQEASALGTFGAIQANQGDIITSQTAQAGFAVDSGRAQADATSAGAMMSVGQNVFNLGSNIFQANGGFKSIFDDQNKVQTSVSSLWDN